MDRRLTEWERVSRNMAGMSRAEIVAQLEAAWDKYDHGRGELPAKTVTRIVKEVTHGEVSGLEGAMYFLGAEMNPREGVTIRHDAFRAAFLQRVKPVLGQRLNRLLTRPRLEHTRTTSYKLPPLDTRFGSVPVSGTESARMATTAWAGHAYDNTHPEPVRSGPAPLLVGKRRVNVRKMTHGHPPGEEEKDFKHIVAHAYLGSAGPEETTYPRGSELERRAVRVAMATREGRVSRTGYLVSRDTSSHGGVDPATVTRIEGKALPPGVRHTITSRKIAEVGTKKADKMERGEYINWFKPETRGWKLRRFSSTTTPKVYTWRDKEPAAYKEMLRRREALAAAAAVRTIRAKTAGSSRRSVSQGGARPRSRSRRSSRRSSRELL